MKKGFTLIELLVVIAIIGILSAIGLVSLNGAREKARDAQAKSDLGQMRTALALYADDNGNAYPGQVLTTAQDCGPDSAMAGVTADSVWAVAPDSLIIPEYLGQQLKSPRVQVTGGAACEGRYGYTANNTVAGQLSPSTEYTFFYLLETGDGARYYTINHSGTVQDYADNETTVPDLSEGL